MSDVIGPHADLLLEERVDDEVVVYNRATDAYYTMNATATVVWDLATGEHSLDGLVAVLAEHFAIAPDEIRSDVADIIREFSAAGLLQSPPPPPDGE